MVSDVDVAAAREAALQVVILVVEDSVTVRLTAAHYLRHSGYTVIEASNADEAIYLIESGITIDIVFSDVQMPGSMDGIEFAKYLENEAPEVPMILTSGAINVGIHASGRSPRRFVRKPYDLDAIGKLIEELVGKTIRPSGA